MDSRTERAGAWRQLAEAITGGPPAPSLEFPPHVEEAVGARFDEPGTWKVVADWMLEQGHAWGHVIAAEARGEADADGRALVAAALGEGSELTWAHGVLTALRLAPPAVNEAKPSHAVLRRLLEHPAARFLQQLQLVLPTYPSLKVERKHADDLRLLAEAVASARLPFLAELELRPAHAPVLENVARRKTDVSKADSLASLLDGSTVPALRRLGLPHSEWNVGLLETLASSRLLTQLEELDLSRGVLGSGAVKVFKAQVNAFLHLKRLDLRGNYFSPAELAALKRTLPRIEGAEQRAFNFAAYRYIPAAE